jgi:hypothetical protein
MGGNKRSMADMRLCEVQEGLLEIPIADPVWGYHSGCFGFCQTQRFYQALTAHWLAIKALRFAGTSVYDRLSERNLRFDQGNNIWSENKVRSLQEMLDILEVYDFVYERGLRRPQLTLFRDNVSEGDFPQTGIFHT